MGEPDLEAAVESLAAAETKSEPNVNPESVPDAALDHHSDRLPGPGAEPIENREEAESVIPGMVDHSSIDQATANAIDNNTVSFDEEAEPFG
jgi:hypothetical protein